SAGIAIQGRRGRIGQRSRCACARVARDPRDLRRRLDRRSTVRRSGARRESRARNGRRPAHARSKLRMNGMRRIEGGIFAMGSERFYPEEAPVRNVHVDGFWIDEVPVTNAMFSAFIDATGYRTFAEQAPDPGDYPEADPALLR